jgi:SAM-dependent methyltransferase
MRWPEIEYFIEDLKNKMSSSGLTRGSTLKNGIEDSRFHGNDVSKIRILDVGCGSGRLYGELQKADIDGEYLGIDSSAGMIEEARKAYLEAKFEVLDMLNLDTLDTKFDVIFLLASFHHLELESDRITVLQKLKKILAPGAVVYMTNWNLLSDENMRRYESAYRGNGDFDIKIGTHTRYYHGFTVEELTELIEQSGLKTRENRIFESERNVVTILNLD